jgi:hypothetical protein
VRNLSGEGGKEDEEVETFNFSISQEPEYLPVSTSFEPAL